MEVVDRNDREIADSYLSSLVDLTNNSKPLINMLTMLAEENIEHGQTIVDAVEQRIAKVEPDLKLPILYLIDSIVKNVGGVYIKYFSQTIVKIFIGAFEKVNEDIRKKMFALRQTWNDVFPPAKLYTLDVKVNAIDHNWPITAQKIAPAIHVNPNFFSTTTEKDIQTELQIKQRELLELKKRKLELELAATQKQLATTTVMPPTHPAAVDPSIIVNTKDLAKQPVVLPVVTKPTKIIAQPAFIPNQMPTSNVRPRIAPVNSALVSSMRIRDPRLARQPPQMVAPAQNLPSIPSINDHFPSKLPPMGPIPRISNSNFAPNADRNQRMQPIDSMPYNDTTNKAHVNNSNNSNDVENKNKHKNARSPNKSSSSKSSGKCGSSNSSSKSKSTSSSSSSSKNSSSKSERNSRSSSSGSSSKKSKGRKDDKSPLRKKSSSRHRSPTSSRRSSSPADAQKTSSSSSSSSRKTSSSSSYDSKSKSSDSKHSKEKNSDSHSSISSKSSPNHRNRNRSSRSKSPTMISSVTKSTTDSITKDIDLRAHLPQPISLTNSLISSTIIDQTSNVTTSVAIIASNAIADRKFINLDKQIGEDAPKDIDFRVGLMTNMSANQAVTVSDTKKRLSEETDLNEPKNKKTKSEKIDILFGTEDVDLRIPPPSLNTIAAPAVISASVVPDVETKPQLEASETNASHTKLSDQLSNSKKINRDIDLRHRPDVNDENSQESNDKFKMILMQAQEQVENNPDVDPEKIQSMVQQIIKIKCDSEARKTFKRGQAGKSNKANENEDGTEAFSSGSDDETLKQSHRVPFKRRRQENDRGQMNSNAPVAANNSTKSPNHDAPNAPQKERRPRKTKWNSPWEEQVKPPILPMQTLPSNIIPAMPFAPLRSNQPPMNITPDAENMRNVRQFSSRNVPESVWQPNAMPFNGPPVVNQLGLLNNAGVPANLLAGVGVSVGGQIVMAQHGPSLAPCTAKDRTINIDGVPREIRFYDETAIAFMESMGREPKEIGFQSGERRVCVDNNESIVLAFNDTYKPFVINGQSYQIRFGTPTRELYIDNEWYECYFGDPAVGIVLNGKLHSFRIDGPAPQVRIGNVRNDLVVGKIDMYVDMTIKVPLFLDAQVQMFQVNNQVHTIQFADYFLTVIIDNIPFQVQYGAMPAKFQLANSEHYIRFSVLPNSIVPGEIYVRNMKRTHLQRDLVSPVPTTIDIITSNSSSATSLLTATAGSGGIAGIAGTSSQSNVPVISESSNPAVDINDLYQKLLASGILNKVKEKEKEKEKEREKPSPILLNKPETLKKRQPVIISALFSGSQCSCCGVRFPLEQTIKYSQHLDWHYRQNRRERDSARRAQSRKWYYSVADWIQYEEIENLDEREKNWFETQQTEMDSANEESNQRSASPPPSCVAAADDHNKTCDMCHDPFETFYNEETEEWHLRNAIRVEENIYHPICYEDHKLSLTLDESNLNASSLGDISTDDNAVDLPIKHEEDQTVTGFSTNANERIPILDDDDDVIVLPQEEPVITEIPDDDDHEPKQTHATNNGTNSQAETGITTSKFSSQNTGTFTQPDSQKKDETNIGEDNDEAGNHNESDVQILEPQISILNLDEYEETNVSSNTLDESLVQVVKIKEEPKYEGYEDDEDDGFEEVGTFAADAAEIFKEASVEDSAPLPPIQTQSAPIATLDGNIELQEAQPITVGTNKIKINISKNVQLNKNSINSTESVDNNLAINNKESADGQTQGIATNKSVVANDTDRNGSIDANEISTANSAGGSAATAAAAISGDSATSDIEYEVKDSIKHVQFKRQPVVQSGLETSGLCSIM
ncbi:uncharacterized protein LOC129573660 isoform X2 [Sitodiplosis mosellana]|uniref:uncharacterized protein LOC129573660 isoform X2 n=1 Tax=Sitodiplosis mosellana TaxID=263140 RepID=UPI0024437D3E|nr:uncharacterized protein LOC129573660 isoform X2 [Sitodiplosis mosellana]